MNGGELLAHIGALGAHAFPVVIETNYQDHTEYQEVSTVRPAFRHRTSGELLLLTEAERRSPDAVILNPDYERVLLLTEW